MVIIICKLIVFIGPQNVILFGSLVLNNLLLITSIQKDKKKNIKKKV